MARSEDVTIGNGSLLKNGEDFGVEGNTLNPNLSLASTPVPAPTVDASLNLGQNEGVIG